MSSPIVVAIPVFLVLIGVEIAVSARRAEPVHRFADTACDLACGIGQQAISVALKGALVAGYAAVHEFAVFRLDPNSLGTWLLAVVGADFTHYWWHRASHRINALWAIHGVHHQSEECNLAVALRQAWFSNATAWVFDLPLALAGVPASVFLAAVVFRTLYQFWVHTRLIGKLGALESVLVTPSHHRVHHAKNVDYLDKNFGATFIVWDRLFGTFAPEVESPRYGTLRPYRSWNPLWANVDVWAHLARQARGAVKQADKWRVWFMPPEWQPAGAQGPLPAKCEEAKYDPPATLQARVYVALQFIPVTVGLLALLQLARSLSVTSRLAWIAVLLASLGTLCRFVDGKGEAWRLEAVRLALLAGVAALVPSGVVAMIAVAPLVIAVAFRVRSGAQMLRARGASAGAIGSTR
ncbi:MAG TPA: sterol desaturase family protein, partial [Vicinamibacterales bacterium]|nr:sterol desaturase family protein [Vicinamibacterales bacterium]